MAAALVLRLLWPLGFGCGVVYTSQRLFFFGAFSLQCTSSRVGVGVGVRHQAGLAADAMEFASLLVGDAVWSRLASGLEGAMHPMHPAYRIPV